MQLVTPRETRASKKRKSAPTPGCNSSPPTTPSTPAVIPQIDGGNDATPSGCLTPPYGASLTDSNGADDSLVTPSGRGTPPYRPPPTPLPMSQYFPTPPLKVICLEDSHFTRYNQCECCHDKLKWQIVGFSKTL